MYYPLCLSVNQVTIAPLFGEALVGEPHVFDFSSANPEVASYDTDHYEEFQDRIFGQLKDSGRAWGIGRYLEERRLLLARYPQMEQEGRYFHVGLDIVVPPAWPLYAPLAGVVEATGFDAGTGNYGGYLILRHEGFGEVFYSFYGHLQQRWPVALGETVKGGQQIGWIGEAQDSGGWFSHTHLQVITEKAKNAGRTLQGYVTAEDLGQIETLFPSPYPLFKVGPDRDR